MVIVPFGPELFLPACDALDPSSHPNLPSPTARTLLPSPPLSLAPPFSS